MKGRLRRQEGVVKVEHMPLVAVDQGGKFHGQTVLVSPGLGLRVSAQGTAILQKDFGRGMIGPAEGDSDSVDEAAFGLVDDFAGKGLVGGSHEKTCQVIRHIR